MIYPPHQKPPLWSIDPGIIAYSCQKAGMPHPVLAMPMWEGAGNLARDYSGHGNNGTLTSGAYWAPEGIRFDGINDIVHVPHSDSVNIGGDAITLCAMVRRSANTQSSGSRIITKEGVYALVSRTQAAEVNNIRVHILGASYIAPSNLLYLDSWNYVIATYNGSVIKVYIDGVEKHSANASGNISTSSIDVGIAGKTTPTSNTMFPGDISNVNIYDVALSATQVKFLSSNPCFMYQIPEELYGYVAGAPPTGNPFWYYNMLKRRNA